MVKKTLNDRFEVMNPWLFGLVERRSTYHRFMAEVYNGMSNEARNLKNQYMEDPDLNHNVMFQSIVPGEALRLSARGSASAYKDQPLKEITLSELKDNGQQGVMLRSTVGLERGSELQLPSEKDFSKPGKAKVVADEDSFQLAEQPYQQIPSPNNELNANQKQGQQPQQQNYAGIWGQFNPNGLHPNNQQQQPRTPAQLSQRQTPDVANSSGFKPPAAYNSQIRNQQVNSSQKLGDLSARAKFANDKAQGAMAQNDFLTFDFPPSEKVVRPEQSNESKVDSTVQKKQTLNPFENDQDFPVQPQVNRGPSQQQSPNPPGQGNQMQFQSSVAPQKTGPFTQGLTNQPY